MELQKRIRTFWNAISDRDIAEINNGYCQDEDTYVVLEGPRLATKGFSMISKGWKDFANSPISLDKIIWTEGPYEEIVGDMGWISGVTDLYISVNGKEIMNTFRSSFVMKKEDGDWKIRHEHVSAAHPDPYGVGDWLKNDK
ncbi:nuclear transport factor 2 family protein [uncultured Croceitalea sp.]|uniref:nuclear transport factor 2 family protein n=1 Tax=uncultured Croceitalea sp. TaxID=1798908 RepID=UPI0033066FB9